MRRKTIFGLLVFFLLFPICISGAANSKLEPDAALVETAEDEEGNIWSEVWYLFIDEPDYHFNNARNAFVENKLAESARSIRKGAAYIRLEGTRTEGKTREAISKAARKLESLARKVEEGKTKSVEELDYVFAKTCKVMARHYQDQAKAAYSADEKKKAGYGLKAAASYVERAAKWSGKKVETGARAVVEGAKSAGEKLIKRREPVPREVEKSIDEMETEVQMYRILEW
jgi:hypothetical protein